MATTIADAAAYRLRPAAVLDDDRGDARSLGADEVCPFFVARDRDGKLSSTLQSRKPTMDALTGISSVSFGSAQERRAQHERV